MLKMSSSIIGERELRIIEEISQNQNLTQRKISHKLGLSLGMTNIILKRLASKGYIKVKGLNRRKVQYILTPKGFAEKTKKSYRYFLKEDSALNFNGI
jgi:DNA-binding MarR family transcriptional regulator